MKSYNKYNFHKYTFCIFNEVMASEIEHLTMNYVSKSGSSYIFTNEGVYRKSDHWGRAANCKWRLQTNSSDPSRTKIGFAKWSHFHSINEVEKLYYIEVNFAEKTVQYNHKGISDQENLHLRNASETIKRVKEIRNLFDNDKKLQYWETAFEFDDLLKNVVLNLVSTDLNLLAIKNLLSQ
ncbi:hypothetical protein FLAN108750_00425 [Flavobacterium antarcticum]|uniref:hypothetical protein n=1 Tax=Flavobacterium antarcticum TaxID=271155 RepID=UPI0003F70B5C|nr:hypothetical protein [Flavobacterium antarcticum]